MKTQPSSTNRSFLLAGIGCAYLASAPASWGRTLIPLSAAARANALDTSLGDTTAASNFHNPASVNGCERLEQVSADISATYVQADLAGVRAAYSYEHPDFDPVTIDLRVPMPTLGLGYCHRGSVEISAAFAPSAAGQQRIPGLPRRFGSRWVALEIINRDLVLHGALGLRVRRASDRWGALDFGVAAAMSQESRTLKVGGIDDMDNPLLQQETRGMFGQVVTGLRWNATPAPLVGRFLSALGLATRLPVVKHYSGSVSFAGIEAADAMRTEYLPWTLALGLESQRLALGRTLGTALRLQGERAYWASGSGFFRAFSLERTPLKADLQDVTRFGGSLLFFDPELLGDRASVTLSMAYLPTPWGDGRVAETTEEGTRDGTLGVDFGNTEGITRRAIAIGYSRTFAANLGIDTSIYHTYGNRTVGDDGHSPGYYQLRVTAFSAGLHLQF